jgi:uncharacterized short protein YbdD (DUF466 family)
MKTLLNRIRELLSAVWTGLRQWSGDAAYERYVECAMKQGGPKPLSESEFYVEQLNRRYSRPNRCC